jgi:hypothetical protein
MTSSRAQPPTWITPERVALGTGMSEKPKGRLSTAGGGGRILTVNVGDQKETIEG